METLTEQLEIADATIEDWTHRKTEKDGLKMHFTVSAPLPKLLAQQLRCSGIYEMDTGRIDLLHKLKDTEFLLTGGDDLGASFFPDVIYKFKASRDENQFTVQFSIHVSTRCEELHELLKHAPETLSLTMRPRQGQLFEDGTRVDVTTIPEKDTGCVACNNGIPLMDGDPTNAAATMGGTHQKRTPRKDRGTVN